MTGCTHNVFMSTSYCRCATPISPLTVQSPSTCRNNAHGTLLFASATQQNDLNVCTHMYANEWQQRRLIKTFIVLVLIYYAILSELWTHCPRWHVFVVNSQVGITHWDPTVCVGHTTENDLNVCTVRIWAYANEWQQRRLIKTFIVLVIIYYAIHYISELWTHCPRWLDVFVVNSQVGIILVTSSLPATYCRV